MLSEDLRIDRDRRLQIPRLVRTKKSLPSGCVRSTSGAVLQTVRQFNHGGKNSSALGSPDANAASAMPRQRRNRPIIESRRAATRNFRPSQRRDPRSAGEGPRDAHGKGSSGGLRSLLRIARDAYAEGCSRRMAVAATSPSTMYVERTKPPATLADGAMTGRGRSANRRVRTRAARSSTVADPEADGRISIKQTVNESG